MMYILTEEELQALKAQQKSIRLENTKKLQALCTKIADEMPIKWSWGGPDKIVQPWGCIKTKGSDWYCDQCPVHDICPSTSKRHSQ